MKQRPPKGRPINGILLLDKPSGITSNTALQKLKHLFHARKAGHTGSLDLLASGMLPLCFGEATKFSQFLLDADKRYRVTARLGIKTSTGDAEGEIIAEQNAENITTEQLKIIFQKFMGNITQVPSMYSALKHQGQPLYKLARQGIEIQREARPLTIYSLELLKHENQFFTIDVHCSKGTYIRTLIEDIGDALKCGAYVTDLRRLSAGPYQESQMHTIDFFEKVFAEENFVGLDKYLLPVNTAVTQWPKVEVTTNSAFYLKQGQAIMVPHAPTQGMVQIFLNNNEFLGVGEILDDGKVAPRRLIQD